MVKVATYFGMSLAAFVFWQSMDKVHVWIALRQDEKVLPPFITFFFIFKSKFNCCYSSSFNFNPQFHFQVFCFCFSSNFH
jgi:hypothetical protein